MPVNTTLLCGKGPHEDAQEECCAKESTRSLTNRFCRLLLVALVESSSKFYFCFCNPVVWSTQTTQWEDSDEEDDCRKNATDGCVSADCALLRSAEAK
jgi:hypothetical protein